MTIRYLSQPDEAAAIARSRAEALSRGCGPKTLYWWLWFTDPESGAAVLLIEDGDQFAPGETASAEPPDWYVALG